MADGGQAASRSSSGPDPLIGRTINDRFKITALIARGGMGKVYRAEQAPLGRACAVKVLNPNYAGEQDPEFHKRFFLEASIASKLTHPNTVTIFDYGKTDDDVYYMAMELLDGVTLHRAIRTAGAFPEDRAAHIGRQVCRALREAHSMGVIHRDLKPANIFLTNHGDESDFVKVLDFGLVKPVDSRPEDQLTQTGLFMGSPKYMAPEQIRGEKVDVRTDVYSLGILMYEMLTGKVPFDRTSSLNILMAQVNDDAPPIHVMNPGAQVGPLMEELVMRCLAKDPAARPSAMDDVLLALKQVGSPLAVTGTGEFRVASASGSHPLSASGSHRVASASSSGSGSSVVFVGGGEKRSSRPPGVSGSDAPTAAFSGEPHAAMGPSSGPGANAPSAISSQQVALPLLQRAGSVSGASATPPPTEVPNFRSGTRALAMGVVGAVAVAGIAFALLRAPSSSGDAASAAPAPTQPGQTAAATPSASSAAAPAPPPTAPAAPQTLTTRFTTEPSGASVKEDGKELCATTPCDHEYEADVTREHKLVFSKPGFRPEARTIHAGDSPVNVRLVAARTWAPGPAPQAKPADTNASTPQGFKEIPY